MSTHLARLAALAAAGALALAACTGSGTGAHRSGLHRSARGHNAAVSGVVNPSGHTGGTMTFDLSGKPDSTDYQNTYAGYMWDFVRLYSMQLLTYRSCPGGCGLELVPDLATGLGVPSKSGRVWTYHLKANVKFQNGDVVTAADVKYGVERTYAKDVLPAGPTNYQLLLQDPGYLGPYTDRAKNLMGLTSVTTPNPTTVVFHLNQPFPDFNYVVAIPQSTPVEPSWDTGAHGGANFQLDPESTGPYQFQRYALNKQLTLVPNKYWNPATDPQAKQLASKIIVNMNVSQAAIDQSLLAGTAQMDLRGLGVQAAAAAKILTTPSLKADADNPVNGFLRFAYINTRVIPNVHCREAIEYAANKTTLQDAYGGPVLGGQLASTVLPPTVLGYRQFDLYKAISQPAGDVPDAKAQLRLCGKAAGFSFVIAFRSDVPGDAAAAAALQAGLRRAGITTTVMGVPIARYYTGFAGVPGYVHSHNLGIAIGSWGAAWPDGWGFLYDLSDGSAIIPVGNSNIAELDDPAINATFNQAATQTSQPLLQASWPKIDLQIMKDAAILPIVYQKVLLYRPPSVTNVYADEYYGMFNYAVLGLK
jgi:peptide/nickel transport system substrate-binding protein